MVTRYAMITHSAAPPTGARNVRAIEGRPMLTIEASSAVMNVPSVTTPRMAHPWRGSLEHHRALGPAFDRMPSSAGPSPGR